MGMKFNCKGSVFSKNLASVMIQWQNGNMNDQHFYIKKIIRNLKNYIDLFKCKYKRKCFC